MDMNLKEYSVQPDEGLYENIQRRLRLRRRMRLGGVVAGVAVVSVAALLLLTGRSSLQEGEGRLPVQHQEAVTADVTPSQPQVQAQEQEVAAATPVLLQRPATANVQPAAEPQPLAPTAVAPVPTPQAKPVVAENREIQAAPVVAETPAATPAPSAPASQTTSVENEPAPSPVKGPEPVDPPLHIDNLLWAPNIIVPDGDVDDNRTFKLRYSSAVTEFQINIYNRRGIQVFASSDPAFEWDGTHNGTRLPQSAYVWVAKFRDSAGKMRQEKGTVTVIR